MIINIYCLYNMEATFPINYRAGRIEPVVECIPEIMEPKPV